MLIILHLEHMHASQHTTQDNQYLHNKIKHDPAKPLNPQSLNPCGFKTLNEHDLPGDYCLKVNPQANFLHHDLTYF